MAQPTVVLVHGAFADASGWAGVIRELITDGYDVIAPPNPLRSLSFDAGTIETLVKSIDGPVVLVGHSYGGAVVTQASAALDNVTALVYIAAFGIDEGESCLSAQEGFPPTLLGSTNRPTSYDAPGAPGGPDIYVAKDGFRDTFCGDSTADVASVLYATQRPLSAAAYTEALTGAGWKKTPSWYLISEDDNAIPPEAQKVWAARMNATTESIKGSHTAFVAQPVAAADFIKKALK
ncbi:alpha/beta fold hydrolase [Lacisediminihabitans sp.]|uniref:alpha/beta fold hydrolase n=1 Tax=Lacisediminihabitans sp. TaxID=2787631 RepID=UPI00374DCC34